MGKPVPPLQEFLDVVNAIYGLHCDCLHGLALVRKQIASSQEVLVRDNPGMTIDDLDRKHFLYGDGDPRSPNTKIRHKTTQGQFKARNAKGGQNEQLLGNLCLVLLYQYWEDFYRGLIADSVGMKKKDLLVPVMGDVHRLRRSIVHHGSIALPDVESCEVLKWFHADEAILIDEPKFRQMIDEIRLQVAEFAPGHLGPP